MTIRSFLVGIFFAAAICAAAHFNDSIIRQNGLVNNNFPFSIYGVLLILLLVANPLLSKLKKRFAFTGKELAVILTLTLVGGSIPGVAFMRPFITQLIIPHRANTTDPGWKDEEILDNVPKQMLVDVEGENQEAVTDFVQGSTVGEDYGFADVPWGAWLPTLSFWIPLFLLIFIAMIALSCVVHKQWKEHEHLPYPIAKFATTILPEEGQTVSSVFRTRIFWIGAGIVLLIHMVNYVHAWWPEYTFSLPMSFDFTAIQHEMDIMNKTSSVRLFRPKIIFSVLAIAYFLAADVSLSVAIGPWLFVLFIGILKTYGLWFGGGGYYGAKVRNSVQSGAYVGMMLMIIYTGRHYYLNVIKSALRIKTQETIADEAKWGMRVFLTCILIFIVDLVMVGLPWPFAILYTILFLGLFLVLSRVMVETGVFLLNPFWSPGVVILAFFGTVAVGPTAGMIMFIIASIVFTETRGSLMPVFVNALGLLNEQRVKVGRVAISSVFALIIAIAVAFPVSLFFIYQRGIDLSIIWTNRNVPRLAFWTGISMKEELRSKEKLEVAEEASGFQRFTLMSPDKRAVTYFLIGLGLVITFAAIRLRWPHWWLHPVMFIVWGTLHAQLIAASFLLGWLIKVSITKYGGVKNYHAFKPFMIGAIAGDVIAGVLMTVIGAIYYLQTGEVPVCIRISS